MKIEPNVVLVHVPGSDINVLVATSKREGIDMDVMEITGASDYYALPGILPMLTKPSKLDLLIEIMNFPLPVRKAS
jgi:hypothetical protein